MKHDVPNGPSGPGGALLAAAFDAAPCGFVLVDGQGVIRAANRQMQIIFGHTPSEMIGQPLEMLLPLPMHGKHASLRAEYNAHPEPRAMGAGRDLYARHADGHEFPVEIGLTPMPVEGDRLTLASVVNIGERKALESAFKGVFEAAPYGLLVVDDAGQIAMVNKALASMLGHVPSELMGHSLERLLPERYRGGHARLMHGYTQIGEARMMGQGRDLTALHADGTELPVEIGLSRVTWRNRTMTLAVMTDISARKRLINDLKQANADLQEFTYVASHDLRSPLRGISDLVEWITDDLACDRREDVTRNLGRVTQRIHKMERLIDDLLRYARASKADTACSNIHLQDLVQGILDLQPPPPGFKVSLAVTVPVFQAAKTPLETVLRNLLSNAVKHHDRDAGHLTVAAQAAGDFVEITVSDDGPGVPESSRERVFKLFQTLTASERTGSGIGLAITKRLVETHGGRIALQSPLDQGRGAAFTLLWPRFQRRVNNDA